MHLGTVADWLAWGALAAAVGVIAWSSYRYLAVKEAEQRQRKFENFFETIRRVHNKDGSLIAQKSAIFELRNYPEYKDVILRICDDALDLFGPNVDPRVMIEFEQTVEALRR